MKKLHILAVAFVALATHISLAQEVSDKTLYLHGFRSPSIGLEYRSGSVGVHAGLYTTILGKGEKSTEFVKVGATGYWKGFLGPRFESFGGVSYVRGQNREYRKKDGLFIEQGFVYDLGKNFEFRLGTGILLAKGFKAKVNPTVGFSYRFKM
jgi:hypothetical protein